MTPEQTALFLGPFGLTLFLMYVVKRLWDAHDRSDNDVVSQRNEAIAGWREATGSIKDLTHQLEVERAERKRQ